MKKFINSLLVAVLLLLAACSKNNSSTGTTSFNGGNTTGQGGSMARFTIVGHHLYTVDGRSLRVFDISNPSLVQLKNSQLLGWDIEAIFPFRNKLFIASNTAMYLFNINNPEQPVQESYVQHLTGCDPVVANDSVAYLTIHGGNRCGSNINELQVYDIRNVAYPQFITRIPMNRPMGLGMKDTVLFVCDDQAGIRLFSISNPYAPRTMYVVAGDAVHDVIPMDTTLVGMMPQGLAIYDIRNLNQVSKLGEVKN